jgi:hypothetical protein
MVPKRGLADGDFNFIVDSGLVYLLRKDKHRYMV